MSSERRPSTHPKYDREKVEAVALHEVIEQHPARLTVEGLTLRIVADPEDSRELDTALKAIRGLRESGLIRYRDEEGVVEPSGPALRAHALLTAV